MRFGGLTALDDGHAQRRPRRDLRAHRPERRGQDDRASTSSPACTSRPNGEVRVPRARPLGRLQPHEITKLGIARTFQNIRLFREMTALENVMVGADAHHRTSVPRRHAPARRGTEREEARRRTSGPCELLEFVGHRRPGRGRARNLPYGDQRRLEIARALATEPKLLLPRRARRRLQPGREAGAAWTSSAGSATAATPCC